MKTYTVVFEVDEKLLEKEGLSFENELNWLLESGIQAVEIKEEEKNTFKTKLISKVVNDIEFPRIEVLKVEKNEEEIICVVEEVDGKLRTLSYTKDKDEPIILNY